MKNNSWYSDLEWLHQKVVEFPASIEFLKDERIGPPPDGALDVGRDMRRFITQAIAWSHVQEDGEGWLAKSPADWESMTGLDSYGIMVCCRLLSPMKLLQVRVNKQILRKEDLSQSTWYYNQFQIKVGCPQLRRLLEDTGKQQKGEARVEVDPMGANAQNISEFGVVYLVAGKGCYKIGKTLKPDSRMTRIALQMPFPVELIHTIRTNDVSWLERHWHAYFSDKRMNGEWFDLSEKDVDDFKAMAFVEVRRPPT